VEGFASASTGVRNAIEDRQLAHRIRDDNRQRHAGIYALYDWCWGGDDQWLYGQDEDRRVYSHDHGHFFPRGPGWTEQSLLAEVDRPHPRPDDVSGLDTVEVERLASALDSVSRASLIEILSAVPDSWPITNAELEALGYFLEYRCQPVAARLRRLVGVTL